MPSDSGSATSCIATEAGAVGWWTTAPRAGGRPRAAPVRLESPISERGDVQSQKRWKKKGLAKIKARKNSIYKSVGPLVRPLWRAAAPGLKPLRLPRAWQSCSLPGLPALPITGLTTRAFPPSPPVAKPARNRIFRRCHVFVPHSTSFVSLPAPLPDNSIIIVIVVGVWSVLFMWQVSLHPKTRFQTRRPRTPRRV